MKTSVKVESIKSAYFRVKLKNRYRLPADNIYRDRRDESILGGVRHLAKMFERRNEPEPSNQRAMLGHLHNPKARRQIRIGASAANGRKRNFFHTHCLVAGALSSLPPALLLGAETRHSLAVGARKTFLKISVVRVPLSLGWH